MTAPASANRAGYKWNLSPQDDASSSSRDVVVRLINCLIEVYRMRQTRSDNVQQDPCRSCIQSVLPPADCIHCLGDTHYKSTTTNAAIRALKDSSISHDTLLCEWKGNFSRVRIQPLSAVFLFSTPRHFLRHSAPILATFHRNLPRHYPHHPDAGMQVLPALALHQGICLQVLTR